MATLSLEQSQALYNNATQRAKKYVNGVFNTIRLHSKLDGFFYYVDSARQSIAIDENSTDSEIETAIVNFLQTQEYLGTDPIGTSVNF